MKNKITELVFILDRVRSAIPAEIPYEEMEAYTEKALEYYQQLLQKRKARDAR